MRPKRLSFQRLEQRTLLAAGLIPIELRLPLDQSGQTSGLAIVGNAIVNLDMMVIDPGATGAGVFSLSAYDFASSGTFSGSVEGVNVTGNFSTNAAPINDNPTLPFELNATNRTISTRFVQTGTFNATTPDGPRPGTFNMTIDATFDFNSRQVRGFVNLDFVANDFQDSVSEAFTLSNAVPVGAEYPDATKASVGGRAFSDVNQDGLKQATEAIVKGVRATLLDTSGTTSVTIESVLTDPKGFYAFYNLSNAQATSGKTAIRFDQLPVDFDFTRFGGDLTIEGGSDANSLDGTTRPITFSTNLHRLAVDVGLRRTIREFNNPNIVSDVDNDGETTAADALAIINLLSRLSGSESEANLAGDRQPGDLFYDVDGNGMGTAADALAVLFAIFLAELGESEPEAEQVQPILDSPLDIKRCLNLEDDDQSPLAKLF